MTDYKTNRSTTQEIDGRTLATYKLLASDIYQFFHQSDHPPADEIYVPVDIMRKVNENTFDATIRFIVDYCGRKVHNIRIRFNVDSKLRFLNNSWRYL